jgi:hypothetical protein
MLRAALSSDGMQMLATPLEEDFECFGDAPTREEIERELDVAFIAGRLQQAATGGDVIWTLALAFSSLLKLASKKQAPIDSRERDQLLEAIAPARVAAKRHLPDGHIREQLDVGMDALIALTITCSELLEGREAREAASPGFQADVRDAAHCFLALLRIGLGVERMEARTRKRQEFEAEQMRQRHAAELTALGGWIGKREAA